MQCFYNVITMYNVKLSRVTRCIQCHVILISVLKTGVQTESFDARPFEALSLNFYFAPGES